jgi:hypothetical protein
MTARAPGRKWQQLTARNMPWRKSDPCNRTYHDGATDPLAGPVAPRFACPGGLAGTIRFKDRDGQIREGQIWAKIQGRCYWVIPLQRRWPGEILTVVEANDELEARDVGLKIPGPPPPRPYQEHVGKHVKLTLRGDPCFGVALRWGTLVAITGESLMIGGYHDCAGISTWNGNPPPGYRPGDPVPVGIGCVLRVEEVAGHHSSQSAVDLA